MDFIENTAHVKAASVGGVLKDTKTKTRAQKVEMKVHFQRSKNLRALADADAIHQKAWVTTLKKAGVRYRNPYQTRHTYATMYISQ